MFRSSFYSIQLPYLGAKIFEDSSSSVLVSLQKPLRELSRNNEQQLVDHRILITEDDLLILDGGDAASKEKRTIICSDLDSIADVQTLKFSIKKETEHEESLQGAFLPIGSEDQDRFSSIYSLIDLTVDAHLTSSNVQRPLVLLTLQRSIPNNPNTFRYDCHVFSVHRESLAFELCDLLRKLLSKRNTQPAWLTDRMSSSLNDEQQQQHHQQNDPPIRYFERPRSMTKMEYSPILTKDEDEQHNNHCQLNVTIDDLVPTKTNLSVNPCSFSSLLLNPVQHSTSPSHHTSQVLTNTRSRAMSPSPTKQQQLQQQQQQQRNFIKSSSSIIKDESEEIVDDLMNLVAVEKSKTPGSNNKRQASYDPTTSHQDFPMNKKRHFHHRKRSFHRMPSIDHLDQVHSMIESPILRPSMMINRYADIGNYVPKLLRENVTMRSSDSNENIFFRSSHGHLLNGFLQLDVTSTKPMKEKFHYDQETISLIQPIPTDSRKSYRHDFPRTSLSSSYSCAMDMPRLADDYRVLQTPKSRLGKREAMRVVSYTPSSQYTRMNSNKIQMVLTKPKRAHSLNIIHTEIPLNYRQYLRPTGQGAYLYADQAFASGPPPTLASSLGYFP